MSRERPGIIRLETIRNLLMDQEDYIPDFARASIQSFSDFSEHFREHLLNRDMSGLRRAGHKIKPVAGMLDVNTIVDEYEKAKQMLEAEHPREELLASADRIESICNDIIRDFEVILEEADESGDRT